MKTFSAGKKRGGMRVVQLMLSEEDAAALVRLAKMADASPEAIVAKLVRKTLKEVDQMVLEQMLRISRDRVISAHGVPISVINERGDLSQEGGAVDAGRIAT